MHYHIQHAGRRRPQGNLRLAAVGLPSINGGAPGISAEFRETRATAYTTHGAPVTAGIVIELTRDELIDLLTRLDALAKRTSAAALLPASDPEIID
jgi:hypothetical protein